MRNSASPRHPVRHGRWIMLMCSLALVGILLAAQQHDPHLEGSPSAPRTRILLPPSHRDTLPRHVQQPTSTTTITHSLASGPRASSVSSSDPVGASSLARSAAAATPSGGLPTQPTETTTVTPVAAIATPTSELRFNGWLQGPTSVSARYVIAAGSARSITATWTGAEVLDLTVDCPGGGQSLTGGSGMSLTASGSSCAITLSGPGAVAVSSVTITVSP